MANNILILLMLSALGHTIWNTLAKRVEERDAFFSLIMGISLVFYSPVAVYLLATQPFPKLAWPWIIISAALEIIYFLVLAKAYRIGPLTTVYPVIRGTVPLATALFGFLFAGLSVTRLGFIGILLIAVGILFINYRDLSLAQWNSLWHKSSLWAVLAGVLVAGYNLSDSMGAKLMSGILFKYTVFIGMFAVKGFIDYRRNPTVSYFALAKKHPTECLVGGLLIFGANSLAVYAMQSTAVAYVASVREISIVFAALLGMLWLKEKAGLIKWLSITVIVCGVILIKLHNI